MNRKTLAVILAILIALGLAGIGFWMHSESLRQTIWIRAEYPELLEYPSSVLEAARTAVNYNPLFESIMVLVFAMLGLALGSMLWWIIDETKEG